MNKKSFFQRQVIVVALAATAALAGCETTKTYNSDGKEVTTSSASNLKNDLPRRTSNSNKSSYDLTEISRINFELASNYFSYRQFEAAQEAVIRSLAAIPSNTDALMLLGYIQLELRDGVRAKAAFDEALKIAPQNGSVQHNYGIYLCRTGKEDQSLTHFEKALKADAYRGQALTYAAIGSCQNQLGNTEAALKSFESALEHDPEQPGALIGVAEIAFKKGDPQKASRHLRRFQRNTAASPESLWLDVRISRALGKKDDERMASTDLKQRFPDSPQAQMLESATN